MTNTKRLFHRLAQEDASKDRESAGILYYDAPTDTLVSTRSGRMLVWGGGIMLWRDFQPTDPTHVEIVNRMVAGLADDIERLLEANDILSHSLRMIVGRDPLAEEPTN